MSEHKMTVSNPELKANIEFLRVKQLPELQELQELQAIGNPPIKMSRRRLPPRHLMPTRQFCSHPALHGTGITKADNTAARSVLRTRLQILHIGHSTLHRRYRPVPQVMGSRFILLLFHHITLCIKFILFYTNFEKIYKKLLCNN